MLNSITNHINNLWQQWNIQGLILFSLSLQIFLTLCSPLRTRMQKGLLHYSIWLAYLIADWVANFCMGHIASNQVSGGNKTQTCINNTQNQLLVFWAPFLLMHLGGPDTITAFSIEDNKLWSRHMLGFIIQFTTCAYMFLLTLPENKLWIPTVLVFVAGLIKYGERIYALYHGRDYESHSTLRSLQSNIMLSLRIDDAYLPFIKLSRAHPLIDEETEVALEKLMFVFNSLYECCFTKLKQLNTKLSYILRFIATSCVLIALGLFFFNENKEIKQGLNNFDVRVSYTLLCGAVALDTTSLLMLLFSTTFSPVPRILQRIHDYLTRPTWSKCKKKPFTKFEELLTWWPFRRWKGSIPGLNVISYCHSVMTKTTKYYRARVPSLYFRCCAIFMRLHVVQNPFLRQLWVFIYRRWRRRKLSEALTLGFDFDTGGSPSEWWIDLILKENSINEDHKNKLMFFLDVKNFPIDSIILMWHIATCLCYIKEKDDEEQIDEREFSKILSDYMFYLLVFDPSSKSISEGRELLSFVCSREDPRYILSNIMKSCFNNDEGEVEACRNLLDGNYKEIIPSNLVKHACELANELWKILPITSINGKS